MPAVSSIAGAVVVKARDAGGAPMAIQDRDRKILWGRSGNRCAICRRELVAVRTSLDREVVIGQEAHIVARSEAGPRGGESSPFDIDAYENLILLCPVHHLLVDSQERSYSSAGLRRLKAAHEQWVRSNLDVVPMLEARPMDLPMVPPVLVNRQAELEELGTTLARADRSARPTVVMLTGMHGVGKSALAAHWVLSTWPRFAGGHLVGDLSRRRHGGPVDLSTVLGEFLRLLGTDDEALPATFEERRRRFAKVTADRRLLVLLDDISDPAEVATLTPEGPGSLVVTTTSTYFEELVWAGGIPIEVAPLSDDAARQLLADIAGVDILDRESEATSRLIDLCAGSPLVLRVCGARIVDPRRGRSNPLASVVAAIEQASDRLRAMSGTGSYAIDSVLDFAYEELSPSDQVVYRRLALRPAGSITTLSTGALAGLPAHDAAAALERLLRAHLVEPAHEGAFRLHDLVAMHAQVRLVHDDSAADREDAMRRLVDWYRGAVQLADRAVHADRVRLAPLRLPEGFEWPDLPSSSRALEWFSAERTAIGAIVHEAVRLGRPTDVWAIAEALWPYCYKQKSYELWIDAYEAAVAAGELLGDDEVLARTRSALARAYSDRGEAARAAVLMAAADDAAQRCDNEPLQASVIEFGGIIRFQRGEVKQARERFRRAREMFDRCNMLRGVAIQDYQLGKCLLAMGAPDRALTSLDDALEGMVRSHDDLIAGRVQRRRGEALLALARHEEALEALAQARGIAERLKLRLDLAQIAAVQAAVADAAGDAKAAAELWAEAEAGFRVLGLKWNDPSSGLGRLARPG